jgi:phosphoribosyl 1,2-cyclic phosphodiesterase
VRAWTLGSGSRGNAILLESGDTRVLVDAGYAARTLARRLAEAQVAPESISAVVLTHEHIDHMRGVAVAQTRWGWQVYGSQGTLDGVTDLDHSLARVVHRGDVVAIGALDCTLHRVPHDAAAPTAVIACERATGFRTAVAHDLGRVPEALADALAEVDLLMLESNHDEEMLRTGPYPPHLQRRIRSETGHLSNRETAELLASRASARWRDVVLLHLSETNNTPRHATASAERALRGAKASRPVTAAPQDSVAGPFGAGRGGRLQLSLAI